MSLKDLHKRTKAEHEGLGFMTTLALPSADVAEILDALNAVQVEWCANEDEDQV